METSYLGELASMMGTLVLTLLISVIVLVLAVIVWREEEKTTRTMETSYLGELASMMGTLVLTLLISVIVLVLAVIVWGVGEKMVSKKKTSRNSRGPFNVRKVAVIGAGSSGITAAKEAMEAGFSVVVFEQTGEIGGNWVFKENEAHSSVYRTTVINTSRQLMAFSDFPMPSHLPTYPHHKQIVKYFKQYAEHFGVMDVIRFHRQVVDISPISGGGWRVSSAPSSSGSPLYLLSSPPVPDEFEDFDAVMICNGHHSVPRTPKFEGLENFKGHKIHSHSYKDPQTGFNFHDKRVVVVGIGNSGVDIANELSRVSKQVYLCTRSGAWVFPKYLKGRALDHVLSPTRLLVSIVPEWLMENVLVGWMMRTALEGHQGTMKSWGLDPHCRPDQMHPTVSHEILHRIGTGTVRIKPQITSFSEDSVFFSDGTSVKADAVIFATGYDLSFPFLSQDLIKVVNNRVEGGLFKMIFPVGLDYTFAIVGLIQPIGAIMPIAEMQSRLISQIWLNACPLPSDSDIQLEISNRIAKMKKRYLNRDRHTIQVDFQPYMDEMAEMIGAKPEVLKNLAVAKELLLSPIWPFQYRLQGPGAKPSIAIPALKTCYKELDERPEKEASDFWDDDDDDSSSSSSR
eukprot:TRINITY_DN3004_c0_g1_i1.p1 TRINITY_DN3004_c0_g1~~TRINITY_DN3004_c0_g1_i1.p1  ORF type:complete len:642 (+),score=224.36 TRINITY_DN3004_c0_g1_i1:51-1928(+)